MSQIPNQGLKLTPKAAQRTADAVRRVLDNQGTRSDQSPGVPVSYQPFWAVLNGESNTSAGWYNWSAQALVGAGNFSNTQLSNTACTAAEANLISGIPVSGAFYGGSVVKMEFAGYNSSNTPTYTFVGPTLAQWFKVISLPDPILSGSEAADTAQYTVPPYVTANSWYNGSQGTTNVSVGVVVAHSVGDVFLAHSVPGISNGSGFRLDSSNKSIGMMEVGTYGTMFETSLNPNASDGSGVISYDILTPDLTTVLINNVGALWTPLAYFNRSADAGGLGIRGFCRLSKTGVWELMFASETLVPCDVADMPMD